MLNVKGMYDSGKQAQHSQESIVGSVVECSPATRAARVRFPDDAITFESAFLGIFQSLSAFIEIDPCCSKTLTGKTNPSFETWRKTVKKQISLVG